MWKEYTRSIVQRLAGLGDSYQLGRIYHSIILTISHLNVPFYCIINNSHIDKDQNLIKDWALQYRIQKLIQGQYDQGLVDLLNEYCCGHIRGLWQHRGGRTSCPIRQILFYLYINTDDKLVTHEMELMDLINQALHLLTTSNSALCKKWAASQCVITRKLNRQESLTDTSLKQAFFRERKIKPQKNIPIKYWCLSNYIYWSYWLHLILSTFYEK